MTLLEKIEFPADIKELSLEELEQLCSELREYIVSCCAANPGHIGASLGVVEIAVALHRVFDTPNDKIVWDVGHQAYAHKILTGRREAFKTNRKLGGISGFPKRSESEYDAFGTGHSSTSISAALGLAVGAQMQGSKDHFVAVIGDGSMTAGLAFEGLNNAGSLKTNLLVILNDNQISIDKSIGALHNHLMKVTTSRKYNRIKKSIWDRLGAGKIRDHIQNFIKYIKKGVLRNTSASNLFDSLGFRYFGPMDGNDIGQMVDMLGRLKEIEGPKLLHVITKKGKGYKPAEENQTVWHAPGQFDPVTGARISGKAGASKFQDVFGQTLLDLAKENEKIIGITPAMATGCSMNIMMCEMPDRAFDVGIAEQHAVTFSAGLAAAGMLPFCNIYSSFAQRAYDNVIHDVALQELKVVLCLDRAGIVGEDGPTHHGAFDFSCFRPIPNVMIAAPLNELELRNMMYSATLPEYGTIIIRYPRGTGNGTAWKNEPFRRIEPGRGVILQEGKDVALLSIGAVGHNGSLAVKAAQDRGVSVFHCDMRFLKPIDEQILAEVCSKVNRIVTLEDGALLGGLYSAVSEYVVSHKLPCKVTGLGMPDKFVGQGTPEELHKECGYDVDGILKALLNG